MTPLEELRQRIVGAPAKQPITPVVVEGSQPTEVGTLNECSALDLFHARQLQAKLEYERLAAGGADLDGYEAVRTMFKRLGRG